jgi:hypothetical protein
VTPSSPEIGESVRFVVTGYDTSVDIMTEWDFDGDGCGDADPERSCNEAIPPFRSCAVENFSYRDSGAQDVTLIVRSSSDGVELGRAEHTVNVSSQGRCDDVACTQEVSPARTTLSSAAQQYSFTVDSSSGGCNWTATANDSWIRIVGSSSGTGDRTLTFSVTENPGNRRFGSITVGTAVFNVTQDRATVAADFSIVPAEPMMGQVVSFTASSNFDVTRWDFGEPNCQGRNPIQDCLLGCSQRTWTFKTAGVKTVKMYVDGQTEPTEKTFTVRDEGQCCTAERRPIASFSSTANDDLAYVGQTVVFTDTSTKIGSLKDGITLTASRPTPDIGAKVVFEVSGVDASVVTKWDFGGESCDGLPQERNCASDYRDCRVVDYTYSESGAKTITVIVKDGTGQNTLGTASVNLTVTQNGQCGGGGGGGGGGDECTFTLTPSSVEISPNAWTNSFEVDTGAECEWSATRSDPWVTVISGGGPGPGTVQYSVEANGTTLYRNATIDVGNEEFTISQEPAEGNVAPTGWRWTIEKTYDADDNLILQSTEIEAGSEPVMSYEFVEAGRYDVRLYASNCQGEDMFKSTVRVVSAPVEDFVVASAVSSDGVNSTRWESEFRFFNPCEQDLEINLIFQPHETDNTKDVLPEHPFILEIGKTAVFDNIQAIFPEIQGEAINGSVKVVSTSTSGCKVITVSRTFNETNDGTLGLFVPTLPVRPVPGGSLNLIGLIEDSLYRSNVRLVNHGDDDVWVRVTLFDKNGNLLQYNHSQGPQDFRSVKVLARSTKQIDQVAKWYGAVGETTTLQNFTVVVDPLGANLDGFATVIDQISGDSVLRESKVVETSKVWVPGVAYAPGVNDAFWQTDVWYSNPFVDAPAQLKSTATYVQVKTPDTRTLVQNWKSPWPLVQKSLEDVGRQVSDSLGLAEASGYLLVEGLAGGPAPQITARTYTRPSTESGTYGLGLAVLGEDDLLGNGEVGFIPGLKNSSDDSFSFRSRIGLLNTNPSPHGTAKVSISLLDLEGHVLAGPQEFVVYPEQLKDIDIFSKLNLGDQDLTATVKAEIVEGSGVAIYARETDNISQDSIFVPAQKVVFGAPESP